MALQPAALSPAAPSPAAVGSWVETPPPPGSYLHPGALPSVDCVFALTMTNSTQMELLEWRLLLPFGLMHRTSVLEQRERDPDGGTAGIARAHTRAWNASLERGCTHTLVFEDDAFFDAAAAERSLPRVETFLRSGSPYDIVLLGWGGQPSVGRGPHPCVYNISGWVDLHAYIISPEAAKRWQGLDWAELREQQRLDGDRDPVPGRRAGDNDGAIDTALMRHHDRGRFYTVRPMVAFQRFHNSTPKTQLDAARQFWYTAAEYFWSQPDFMHTQVEKGVYAPLDGVEGAPSC